MPSDTCNSWALTRGAQVSAGYTVNTHKMVARYTTYQPAKVTVPSWKLTLTLTLSTPWMQAYLGTIVSKFGGDPVICLREERFIARTDTGRLTRDRHDLPRAKVTVPSWKLGTTSSADTRECMRITDTRTDGQTDRRTNRQTDCDDAVRAHMTERIIKFPARPFTGCGPHLPVT